MELDLNMINILVNKCIKFILVRTVFIDLKHRLFFRYIANAKTFGSVPPFIFSVLVNKLIKIYYFGVDLGIYLPNFIPLPCCVWVIVLANTHVDFRLTNSVQKLIQVYNFREYTEFYLSSSLHFSAVAFTHSHEQRQIHSFGWLIWAKC